MLVHEYRKLELDIMIAVIDTRLDDLLMYANLVVAAGD